MAATISILVVDDERVQRETLASILRDQSYKVDTASDAGEALTAIRDRHYDIILTDFRMPGGSGLDVARKAIELCPEAATLLMTAYADVESVIEAMRAGVLDYLLKPLNVESLLRRLEILRERRELRREVAYLRSEVERASHSGFILGNSPAMTEVRKLIEQVADTRGTVLITGESGTGKEVAARQVHQLSGQRQSKFLALNCGAIPENLLESELFGHKKGSFTGAVADKDGLFVAASGGTLFLDEIGDMPRNLQVKLLRAVQEREVTPVGDCKPIKIDARIIAATNRDLSKDVETGVFRKDLYYRINVVEVRMPALRERVEDIPALAKHFVDKFARELGKPPRLVTSDALRRLMSYSWPGNVRELENVVERAMILGKTSDRIEVGDLPAGFQNLPVEAADGPNPLNLDVALSGFARGHITRTLEACGGDKKDAAKLLGMSLSSLYRKLEELGLSHRRADDDK